MCPSVGAQPLRDAGAAGCAGGVQGDARGRGDDVSTSGVTILETEVRELIRRRGVDPARDKDGIDRLVADALADYDSRTALGVVPPLADAQDAVRAVLDAVAGLGPLQRYLDDPEIEEIWINSP